jgi:hypothetical protein
MSNNNKRLFPFIITLMGSFIMSCGIANNLQAAQGILSFSRDKQAAQVILSLSSDKTQVDVGDVVSLYVSVLNPLNSQGVLEAKLWVFIPSGWSVVDTEFATIAGNVLGATFKIDRGTIPYFISTRLRANERGSGEFKVRLEYTFEKSPNQVFIQETSLKLYVGVSPPKPPDLLGGLIIVLIIGFWVCCYVLGMCGW